jgi:hypothetical protein
MASQAYHDWLRAGRPYTLIRPARALQAALQAHGLTVWDFPNEEHQKAEPPEDHTPYSATGWPGANQRWKARGLDIMPRSDAKAHRRENADIARQLIRDRDAGVPGVMWIKYINWTDEDGTCRQERWTTGGSPLQRTTRTSRDKGHVHVSGRSDADNDTRADSYDPIARTRGDDDVSALTDAIIHAWISGVSQLPDGTQINTVKWRISDQQWQSATTAALATVAADAKAGRLAIEALAAAINAGGGSVDTAALIAHIDELAAAERDRELELLQRIADLEAELARAKAADSER